MLLGGEAGLRCGEMIALEWVDVDLAKRQLCVRHSDWNGHVTAPKGGRLRHIPLTAGKRGQAGPPTEASEQRERFVEVGGEAGIRTRCRPFL